MDFSLTPDQLSLLDEGRAFLRAEFGTVAEDEARSRGGESSGPVLRRFRAAMADRGWLALTWPTDYGGAGRSTFEQFLLMDEFAYWGSPAIDLTMSGGVAPYTFTWSGPNGYTANTEDIIWTTPRLSVLSVEKIAALPGPRVSPISSTIP